MATVTAQRRAASYCRTSSEGQRDNTSIPTQKETNENFIANNGWKFVRHFVDESKSGSKIAGRDDFQRMMKDAAKGEFDVLVVADITRFSRDGTDIIESCKTLARDFGVHVVDAKNNFDTRDRRNTLTNFVHAGKAEDDRLGILERTIKGRIKNAENGVPWYGGQACPVGREYSKKLGRHVINDKGRAILDMCHRYLAGESLSDLCKEYGIPDKSKFSYWVRNSQLSGPYYAGFNQPEIGIHDLKVPVPGMPEVVPAKLLAKVKRRLKFNRTNNRTDAKQYRLQGFLHCGCCRKSLTGKDDKGEIRYRHNTDGVSCDFKSLLGKRIEGPILDYLFGRFLDEQAFNEAVARAMPPANARKKLVKKRALAVKHKKQAELEAKRLATAIRKGGSVSLLLASQMELEERIKSLSERIQQLESRLAEMPDEGEIKQNVTMARFHLMQTYTNRDWRNLSQPEIKRFLLNLFGDSDGDAGIYVRKDEAGHTIAEFKGRVQFDSFIADNRAVSYVYSMEADRIIENLKNSYVEARAEVERKYLKAKKRRMKLVGVNQIQSTRRSSPASLSCG